MAFEFELDDGALLVRHESYPDPENHTYQITVTHGVPTHCECPADEAYKSARKHRGAVAIGPPVLEAVHTQHAADGSGRSEQSLSEEQCLTEKDAQLPVDANDEFIDSDEASSEDIGEEITQKPFLDTSIVLATLSICRRIWMRSRSSRSPRSTAMSLPFETSI